jgi:hypothetical protein
MVRLGCDQFAKAAIKDFVISFTSARPGDYGSSEKQNGYDSFDSGSGFERILIMVT